jgi:hypothetical protein
VLVEALRRSDGQGEIVHFDKGSSRTLCSGPGHFSYPATIGIDGDWFMLPEVSEWTSPKVYRLVGDRSDYVADLDIEGDPRLADATLFADQSGVYLFANRLSEGSGILRLWTADSLFSRFVEHPESPVCISPVGGRMAGALLDLDGRIYRLGQDCSRGYGRRIICFEVSELSRSHYRESGAGELSLRGLFGPHTFNMRGDTAYFDFYRERFSPFAGIQRLTAAISKRRALRSDSGQQPTPSSDSSRSRRPTG